MARGSKKVSDFLEENGLEVQVVTLDDSTKTSRMAAEALGCSVAQIAKSIVFTDGRAVVVVISGDRRVDPEKLSIKLGERVKIADADEVRNGTGYVIGGVPPFPHDESVRVFLDSSLGRYDEVWTAAGTPNSVMRVSVEVLKKVVGGAFIDVAK